MSNIDAIVAHARRGGTGFAERRRFTLARDRAIEKLRKFALADPHFYVLELIQSAVANGAAYIDIKCGPKDVTFSYLGGGVKLGEIDKLFDFLFASKDRLDVAYMRSLALGVNALLMFAPERIIVESGDGTGMPSRLVISDGGNTFDVGRGDKPFSGTYVRAEGIDRGGMRKRAKVRSASDGSNERTAVETRCLAASIPIVFNGDSVFGWSTQRTPSFFGMGKALSFDEGEFYGTIGLRPAGAKHLFSLMTFGVLVERTQYELVPGQNIGGTICFDRLHKTADHAGIVRDERYHEMWLRLGPHVDRLLDRNQSALARDAQGVALDLSELRTRLEHAERVVVVKPDAGAAESRRAEAIADTVQAVIFRVPVEAASALRALAGRPLDVLVPDLSDDWEAGVWARPAAADVPEPQVLAPIELETIHLAELELGVDTATRDRLVAAFPAGATAHTTVYSPSLPHDERTLRVELVCLDRVIASVDIPSAQGGHLTRARLPPPSLAALFAVPEEQADDHEGESPATVTVTPAGPRNAQAALAPVCDAIARLAEAAVREHSLRAIAGIGVGTVDPASRYARMVLHVLAHSASVRLRQADEEGIRIALALGRDDLDADPFEIPLLQTLEGNAVSLEEVARMSVGCMGLVYGVRDEIEPDLEGLDRSKILSLDAHSERLIVDLFGDASYVRVDARDDVATAGAVRIRDIALGLRQYAPFPLLVEGGSIPADHAERRRLLDQLVDGLLDVLVTQSSDPDAVELRRHALRHLQWFVCGAAARGIDVGDVGAIPLFATIDGRGVGLDAVRGRSIRVVAGVSLGTDDVGTRLAALDDPLADLGDVPLAVSVFEARLLGQVAEVVPLFDHHFDDVDAQRWSGRDEPAFVMTAPVLDASGTDLGRVGIPTEASLPERMAIRVENRQGRPIDALVGPAVRHGVLGTVRVASERLEPEQRAALVEQVKVAAGGLLDQALQALEQGSGDRHPRALATLLEYAAQRIALWAEPDGLVRWSIRDARTRRILSLPLFALRGRSAPTPGLELLRTYGVERAPVVDWNERLAPGSDPSALAFLQRVLVPQRVQRHASHSAAPVPSRPSPDQPAALTHRLRAWIEALAPHVDARHLERIAASELDVDERMLLDDPWTGLLVNERHRTVATAIGDPTDDDAFAWVLLGCYAALNLREDVITDDHEREFAARVARQLVTDGFRATPA